MTLEKRGLKGSAAAQLVEQVEGSVTPGLGAVGPYWAGPIFNIFGDKFSYKITT